MLSVQCHRFRECNTLAVMLKSPPRSHAHFSHTNTKSGLGACESARDADNISNDVIAEGSAPQL